MRWCVLSIAVAAAILASASSLDARVEDARVEDGKIEYADVLERKPAAKTEDADVLERKAKTEDGKIEDADVLERKPAAKTEDSKIEDAKTSHVLDRKDAEHQNVQFKEHPDFKPKMHPTIQSKARPGAIKLDYCGDPYMDKVLEAGKAMIISQPEDYIRGVEKNVSCGFDIEAPEGYFIEMECFDAYTRFRRRDRITIIDHNTGENTLYDRTEMLTTEVFESSAITFEFRYTTKAKKGPKFMCTALAVEESPVDPVDPVEPVDPVDPAKCLCGKRNVGERIVGGMETDVNEHPWQVGLITASYYDNSGYKLPFCGGTLVSARYVITAAHCMPGTTPTTLKILLGAHSVDTQVTSELEKVVAVRKITVHPNYDSKTFDNDIAVIELATPIDFNTESIAIRPACLPTGSEEYDGKNAFVSGWGTLKSDGSQPNVLHEVMVPVTTNVACNEAYKSGRDPNPITSNMLCAGATGKDSCQGDSGGPLTFDTGTNFDLIGVVSWGAGCGLAGYPGVYARVTALKSFIDDTIGSDMVTCPRS